MKLMKIYYKFNFILFNNIKFLFNYLKLILLWKK